MPTTSLWNLPPVPQEAAVALGFSFGGHDGPALGLAFDKPSEPPHLMFRAPHPQRSSRERGSISLFRHALPRVPLMTLDRCPGNRGCCLCESQVQVEPAAAPLAWVGQTTEDGTAGVLASGRVHWLGWTRSAHRPARRRVGVRRRQREHPHSAWSLLPADCRQAGG